ncbi:lectin-like domain-containing protein [Paludibacterium yongneupense]|uniref:PEP-CTERM sorting domain-containing protein n=1 Tax=Paludibacterium yongneupense TaxID=400061 RepID=UPI00040A784D|nr:PEP-CTERM sorting domain-containing protein [Paludibacterium yongneupense]
MRLFPALAAALSALTVLPASATVFGGNSVNLVGSAALLGNGNLQLVNDANYEAGAAWITAPLSTASSFTSTYSFSLSSPFAGSRSMADGFAFALQGIGNTVVGGNGGNIGYTGLHAVGSVIQSWGNNTAGINTDGNAYDTKAAPANLGHASLVTGTETVSYNAVSHLLSMNGVLTVDGVSYTISDNASINLATRFGSFMYAGFTAATGGSFADERITSFSISPVPEPETYALMMSSMGMIGALARLRSRKKKQQA